MLQQRVGNVFARLRDSTVEVDRIPVHDRAEDEIEAGCAEGLAFERSVTNFASLMKEYGALEFVRSLALVEASLTAPSQCRA